MSRKDSDPETEEKLDRFTAGCLRASGLDDEECVKIVSSPFLRMRLHASIEEQKRLREEKPPAWVGLVEWAFRLAPASLLAAVLIVAGAWVTIPTATPTAQASGPCSISPVSTCSISDQQEGCNVSRDEVVALLMNDNRGTSR